MATKAVAGSDKKPMKKETRNTLIAYSFIAPNFIGFCIFTLVPMVFAIALAFCSWDGVNAIEFVGFQNFIDLVTDKTFLAAFKNTIQGTNPELEEAAELDGANRWQVFWHITLP